ncbi:MAG: DEAD/DEAH box helicase family protein [Burkholderiales bacterium]|nr:DEAD/DEAH box helicase family protein [Burkholderiales bacterium]
MKDFYLPTLGCAVQYDRAVGFFASSMLVEAGIGLSGLIRNKGNMRLIIGHPLSDDDWEAVKNGVTLATLEKQLSQHLADILERAGTERSVQSLQLLSWLIATNSLEIRYAFRKNGMYHEKIGILRDGENNEIVFHGSANESAAALLPYKNFESLAVYPSWKSELFNDYGNPFKQGFEDLWNNADSNVVTVAVPSEFYEKLIAYRGQQHLPPDLTRELAIAEPIPPIYTNPNLLPKLPTCFGGRQYALHPHQEKSLINWKTNSYNGIFALATGAGKTITVIHAATKFSEQGYPLAMVVSVPYQILGEQWVSVMGQFNMRPIKAFYSAELWVDRLSEAISAFLAKATSFLCIVVVNDTLSTDAFQKLLRRIPNQSLFFIGDECHHHSNPVWRERIPDNAKFKIGLSATPWNPGQLKNKTVLESIYGPVVSTYTLADALYDGVLCQYQYIPVPCVFEDDEAEEYERLSQKISALSAQDPNRQNPLVQQQIQMLAARRTRLIGALRSKLYRLSALILEMKPSPHSLFYCAEGYHPLDDGIGERVIDKVTKIVADNSWTVSQITAAETASERHKIISAFDDGHIDAITAIRVLDEGFDVPGCRTAYIMASSNSYRQYVQRRGRVLRQAPGKSHATIYDFFAAPSPNLLQNQPNIWRKQVATELNRIRSFVKTSMSPEEQELNVSKLVSAMGLGAMYYEEPAIDEEELYGN